MNKKQRGPEGLWLACNEMEAAAKAALRNGLSAFEPAVRDCYEAGVQVPTLASKRRGERDLVLSAIFLKKALNDLRAIWKLTCVGYTSQAASIAATLYENALAASCLEGNSDVWIVLKKKKLVFCLGQRNPLLSYSHSDGK